MKALLIVAIVLAATSVGAKPKAVERTPYGHTASGEAVDRIVLRNKHTTVAILTYGGIIDEISVRDRKGKVDNVVLTLADVAAHEARPNFSAIVGRFANRISGGGYVLDGERVTLTTVPGAYSHGGKPNFSSKVWHADLCRTPGCRAVTLSYVSADGENGFPGELKVWVTYSLGKDDALRIDYRAETSRPTVINLTNHAYFNLAGNTSGAVDGQYLQVLADAYTPTDDKKLPTGEIRPVSGPFDLRVPAKIGDKLRLEDPQLTLANGFDHNFVLRSSADPLPVVAQAWDPVTGRAMEVRTTEPGLQVFTANSFNGSLISREGRPLMARDGYALETQHFPDSPNRPEFPSTVLRPGEVFRSTTVYRFSSAATLKKAFKTF